MESRLKPS